MVSPEVAAELAEKMQALYRTQWTPLLAEAILAEFRDDVTDKEYQEAFRRHTLASKFPPGPADIKEHLTAIYMERIRQKQQDQFSRYGKESDDTYKQIMEGRGDTKKAMYWTQRMHEQIALSHEMRAAIAKRHRLDYRKEEDMKLLMQVLDRARAGSENMLSSVEHALQISDQLRTPLTHDTKGESL